MNQTSVNHFPAKAQGMTTGDQHLGLCRQKREHWPKAFTATHERVRTATRRVSGQSDQPETSALRAASNLPLPVPNAGQVHFVSVSEGRPSILRSAP